MKSFKALILFIGVTGLLGCSIENQAQVLANIGNPTKNSSPQSSPAHDHYTGMVLVKSMNFRTAPNPDAPLVTTQPTVYWRTRFKILEENGEWVRACLYDGTEGWLRTTYEGKAYVQKSKEKPGSNPPIDSHQFYELVIPLAKQWDAYCKLDFLYGDNGGLDGKCSNWIALFYSAAKPKQKLMCEYSNEKGLTNEIWEIDRFEQLRQSIDGLPGHWWQYEGTYAQPGFINSADLCTATNLEPFLNWNIDVALPLHQKEFRCRYILGRDDWTISIGAILTSWVYISYDSKTGNFRKTASNDEPMTGSEG